MDPKKRPRFTRERQVLWQEFMRLVDESAPDHEVDQLLARIAAMMSEEECGSLKAYYGVVHLPSEATQSRDRIVPSRQTAADTLLIFVTKPDHAQAIVGDLLEQMEKVRARKSGLVTWLWFWWEVAWIIVRQAGARVRENTILGRLTNAVVKRIGG